MNKWIYQGHFYMGNCMGNRKQQLFFQFQPSSYRDLRFKIQNSKGGPRKKFVIKYGFIVFKMFAQNTQTEQKKLQPSKLQSGREICEKHSKITQPSQTPWCWQFFLNCSAWLQLSRQPIVLFSYTINPYFRTIILWVPPWDFGF